MNKMLFYSLLGFFGVFFLVGEGCVQAVAVPPDHFAYRCSSTPVRCALVSSLLIHSYTFQFGSKYTIGSQKKRIDRSRLSPVHTQDSKTRNNYEAVHN